MFIYNIEGIAQKMKIDFDGITNAISHNGLKGTAREELLKKYLCELLPKKYSVTSGIICDSDGNQSKQQDFIVYDALNNASFYSFNSNSILPIESIYCTIEIKSSLTNKSLKECVENIGSVRKLQRIKDKQGFKLQNMFSDIYPIGFVFAYSTSMSLKKLLFKLSEYEKNIDSRYYISIICILDKGLILRVNKNDIRTITLNTNNSIPVFSNGGLKDSLYTFYLLLLDYLNNVIIDIPSLIKYAEKTNSFKIQHIIPPELLPDEGFYKDKETGIPYNAFKRIDDILKKYPHIYDGKMTYDDIFNYLTNGYIEISDILLKYFKTQSYNIYGYIMDKNMFLIFKENINKYNESKEAKEYVDLIIKKIYASYQKNNKK